MVAYTDKQKRIGIKGGYNIFPYPTSKKRRFNMYNVPFPVHYRGYEDNYLVDEGYAYPEQEFEVYGDTVEEIPMYQVGGRTDLYLNSDFNSDYSLFPEQSNPLSRYGRDNQYTTTPGLNLQSYNTSSLVRDSAPNIKENSILGNNVGIETPNNYYDNMTPADYMPDPSDEDYGNRIKWHDLPIASTAYNLYQGIFGRDKQSHQFNRQAPRALSIMRNLQYRPDYSPLRLSNNRLEQQIRNSSTSSQQMLARLQNSQRRLNDAFARVDRDAQIQNNQYQASYASALNQEGASRARERARIDDVNLQHQAADDAHLAEVARSIDSTINQKRELEQARYNNRIKIAALKEKYKDIEKTLYKLFPHYKKDE